MGALILDAATGVITDEHGWPVETVQIVTADTLPTPTDPKGTTR